MKLSTRDAAGYFARPEPDRTGILIYGQDAMRVALKRQQLLAALLGPGAEAEMRLARLSGSDLRGDPAALIDAVKAVGFFPGPRAVLVEEAGEGVAETVAAALQDWQPGDAQLVITSGALKAASRLRKLFETHRNAYAVGLYDDPPSRIEIEQALAQSGIRDVPGDAMAALTALAAGLGPGDFAQVLDKIALYKLGDPAPLSPADVAANAPQSNEAALDDVLNVVAEAQGQKIAPLIRRLEAQGVTPVGLCIGATRHFRTLYAVAADPGGPSQGAARLRPPVFGARRDRLVRQAQAWGAERLEAALTQLTDTDLRLRSAGQSAPAMALVERTLIRLARPPG